MPGITGTIHLCMKLLLKGKSMCALCCCSTELIQTFGTLMGNQPWTWQILQPKLSLQDFCGFGSSIEVFDPS